MCTSQSKSENCATEPLQAVVVNFPHNPTGFIPSQEAWRSFNQLCTQRNIAVFSDEMYRFLEHRPGMTLPSAADLNPRAVVLGGVSKSLALPGLRIGWLATRDKALLQQVQHLKDFTTICASAPSEVRGTALCGGRGGQGGCACVCVGA